MKKFRIEGAILFSMIFMAFLVFSSETSAQKPNFSGSYTLNASKSTLPQQGQGGRGFGMAARDMTVKQDGNNLTVDRVRPGRDGGAPTTMTEKYTLDGKESVNTNQRGSSKSIVKWAGDSKSLTFDNVRTFNMGGEERTNKSTETWSLTDAKTLQIVSKSTDREGTPRSWTFVYDKK